MISQPENPWHGDWQARLESFLKEHSYATLDDFLTIRKLRPIARGRNGYICYSAGSFGGVRAAMQLRMMLAELGMPSIPTIFPIPKVQDAFEDDGQPLDPRFDRQIGRFFDELEWYANALKQARQAGTPY